MRRAWTLAIVVMMAIVVVPPASAATEDVTILGISAGFDPETVTVDVGDDVRWANVSSINHTSTQSPPLGLWSSGTLTGGEDFSFTMFAAGAFPYRCNIHPSQMRGTVRVTPNASLTAGGKIRVTIASEALDGFEADVQRRDPGGGWVIWKRGVTRRTVSFNPDDGGVYRFRARLTDGGDASGWSPVVSVTA